MESKEEAFAHAADALRTPKRSKESPDSCPHCGAPASARKTGQYFAMWNSGSVECGVCHRQIGTFED